MENTMEVSLKKLKIELPYDLNSTLGHICGEKHDPKEHMFIKEPQCSSQHCLQ